MGLEKEDPIKNAFFTMMNKLVFAPVANVFIDLLKAEEQERDVSRADIYIIQGLIFT